VYFESRTSDGDKDLASGKRLCSNCNKKQLHTSAIDAWKHATALNRKRKSGGEKFTARPCPVTKGGWHACGDDGQRRYAVDPTKCKSKGFINRPQMSR
jgi:hypothetical protein